MASITHWKRHINKNLLKDPIIAEALAPALIEEHCREIGHQWRDSVWSPSVTILTFLMQVLNPSKTLRAAVAELFAQLAAKGVAKLPSGDPSAYCQARKRLPGEAITRVLHMLAERMRELPSKATKWLGRRVWVFDGSSAGMPDEPGLQKRFPQPSGQAPGCGFPVAQFVALFCWTTGAIIDVAIDSIIPHELTLFRTLWDHFKKGDVVLGDRAYSAFVDMALLLQRGVYCVFRLHQRRSKDMRQGKRLGDDDRLVIWTRPKLWLASYGISREEFLRLPETMTVRLIRIKDTPRGFRSRTIVVVTTLLDPLETPADEIRALYRDRWTAELNFRSLKEALDMDVLRGKSVDVVTKEIVMHLVAYNLIRLLMWKAARKHGCHLHRLSFTGTLQRLHAALPLMLLQVTGGARDGTLLKHLLFCIATDRVPARPDRIEPRLVKRRPKQYGWLQEPRSRARRRAHERAR
jgi:Transposase DDE domain